MTKVVAWRWRGRAVTAMTRDELMAALVELMESTHSTQEQVWAQRDETIGRELGLAMEAALRQRQRVWK